MNSKAKGNVSHIQSLLLSVGLSINSFGEINDVIGNSHAEGLTQTQFFNGSSQGIASLYAKSSETSKPGYLSRKASAISERIKLSSLKDCGADKYLNIKVSDSALLESLLGRYYKGFGNVELQVSKTSDLVGKTIKLRSPLYCKAKDGICEKCYNPEYIQKMKLKPGANIGLLASTGMTNSIINLTLKASHVGLSLDQEELNFIDEVRQL